MSAECQLSDSCVHCAWVTGDYRGVDKIFFEIWKKSKNKIGKKPPKKAHRAPEIIVFENDEFILYKTNDYRYTFYLLAKCHTIDVNIILRGMEISFEILREMGIVSFDALINSGYTKSCKKLGKDHVHGWITVNDESKEAYDEEYNNVDGLPINFNGKERFTLISTYDGDSIISFPVNHVKDLFNGIENVFEKLHITLTQEDYEYYIFFFMRNGKYESIKISYPYFIEEDPSKECGRKSCSWCRPKYKKSPPRSPKRIVKPKSVVKPNLSDKSQKESISRKGNNLFSLLDFEENNNSVQSETESEYDSESEPEEKPIPKRVSPVKSPIKLKGKQKRGKK